MKNIFTIKIVGLLILTIALNACKSTENVYKAYYKDANSQTIDKSPIIQTPLLVDLDVSETKISGTFEKDSVSVSYAKSMALNNALKKAEADVLVEPIYETTIVGGNVKVSVTGFPGKYKNFRQPVESDTIYNYYRSNNSVILRQEAPSPNLDQNMAMSNLTKCDYQIARGKKLKNSGITFATVGVLMVVSGVTGGIIEDNVRDDLAPLNIAGVVLASGGAIMIPFGAAKQRAGVKCLGKQGGTF